MAQVIRDEKDTKPTPASYILDDKSGDRDDSLVIDHVPVKRSWKSHVWSSKLTSFVRRGSLLPFADYAAAGLDVPKEEARFLTKLDLTLITSAALGVMIRYLDQ